MKKPTAQPIFLYDDYKTFVREVFATRENGGRGLRQRLAQFLNCQDSYVSLVLSGDRDFSIEQGEGMARFLRLDEDETEYLLNLLLVARAGTNESKRYFEKRLVRQRERYLNLRDRIKIESDLSDADKAVYYSDTLYAKLHMCMTLPGEFSVEDLSIRFREPVERIVDACRFLTRKGLVSEKGGRYSQATKFLFVDRKSPFIKQHHGGWRIDAISSIQRNRDEDLHLSMTFTLSEKDAADFRLKMAEFIDSLSSEIKNSKEEKLMALCLDYYEP